MLGFVTPASVSIDENQEQLFRDEFSRCSLIEVDAFHDCTAEFYTRYCFQASQDSPLHLAFSLDTVRKTLATD